MRKPRINAKVAKLEIGTPVLWSASGIGTQALDNAREAGHIVYVEIDADQFHIMRPAPGQLDTMIKSVNQFGTTFYSFPVPVDHTPKLPQPVAAENTGVTAEPIYQPYDLERYVEGQYIYGYFSPMRPANFMTGIDAIFVYSTERYHDFAFFRQPLAAERVAAWELIPWTVDAVEVAHIHQIMEELKTEKESEPEMTTTTSTPADRADVALQAFIGTTAETYNDTAEQLADLVASSHHLARRLGLDWKSIIAEATKRYADTKPAAPIAKADKPAKAASTPGAVWTLEVELPTGEAVSVERGKPYSHAALLQTVEGWQVWAWVSSKETASKRIGDAKRAGRTFLAHKVVEVKIAASPEASHDTERAIMAERAEADHIDDEQPADLDTLRDQLAQMEDEQADQDFAQPTADDDDQYQIAETALGQQIITNTWPRTEDLPEILPFEPTDEDAQDDAEDDDTDEPMHVKISGPATAGTAVHLSDDGEETYCGIERDDLAQTDAEVTCTTCKKAAAARAKA